MIGNKTLKIVLNSLIFTIVSFIVKITGLVFLILKFVSMPFVPNRNIDHMSDYYTTIWETVQGTPIDNDRFHIVDVTENDRDEIVKILHTLSQMNPKVIGFDVNFIYKGNQVTDSLFVEIIKSNDNIVLPLEYNKKQILPGVYYEDLKDKEHGVVSFPYNRGVLRHYYPRFSDGQIEHKAFACVIAEKYGADLSKIYKKRRHLINYTTLSISDDHALRGDRVLNLCERDSVKLASQILGKIVLLGSTRQNDDHHMTPLGHSLSGVMIHAHIVNSIIDGKVVKCLNDIITYLLCFCLSCVVLSLDSKKASPRYIKNSKWSRILKSLSVFLMSILVFSVLGAVLYCKFNFYVDFAPYIVLFCIIYLFKDKILK